mmetsp:Transcript_40639/g.100418  ORF Transcript_40639/g.100418 Transcript_40639/m.100418 type:complete len:383 (-) Transcript_40639:167-1315(-)
MGCCASTPAGQIKVLPRSYRRASLRAGPEPPAYYANMREGSSADLKNERVNRRSNTLRPDDSKLFSVLPRSTLGICKLATVTMVGMDPLNPRKTNQDNLFCDASYVDEKSGLFVVFDGHGTYGHQVSTFLANSLPHALCEKLKNAPRSFKSAFALGDFNGAWQKTELEKLVKGVFTTINKALQQSPIQTRLSGSTCCSLLVANKKFITANVGDSRCVAAYTQQSGGSNKIVARALTSDHKPTLPSEMERVLALGGRVEPWEGSGLADIYRVWLKDEESPGIAMSRSFGDDVAATIGIIAEPELQYFDVTDDLAFVLLATDGVWEFMTDQEAVNFVWHQIKVVGRTFHEAIDALAIESSERWFRNEGSIDDITIVALAFNPEL